MKRHNMLLFVSSLAGFWIIIMSLLLIKTSANLALPEDILLQIQMITIASISLGFLMLIGGLLTNLHQYFAGGVILIIASIACLILRNNINIPGIVLGLIAGIDALLRKEKV